MKKIGFFIPDLGGGGAEKVITNLLKEVPKKINEDLELILFVNKAHGPNIEQVPSYVTVIELNGINIIFTFIKLAKLIKSENIDCFVSTVRGANITTALSRFLFCDYKWVLREANTFTASFYKSSFKEKLILLLCKLLYQKADRVIANSPDTMFDIINTCYGIEPNSIYVLPNPVVDKVTYKNKINNNSTKKIIAVGRLVYQKDFFLLIESIRLLLDKCENIVLDIYGEGPLKKELTDKINSFGLNSYINILPFNKNIMDMYSDYDLFVLSSRWEGFGNVLVEAMSCGVPIVSLNCPGGPSFILSKETELACLVEGREPAMLSSSMFNMITRDFNLTEINEYANLAEEYTVSNVVDSYLSVMLSS